MRAAVIREFGTPDIFRIEDVATPQPGRGNVLIKILAAGVNRFDQYIREGSVVPELTRIMREGAVEGKTQEPPCGTNVVQTTF